MLKGADLKFSGHIFLYTEDVLTIEEISTLEQKAAQTGVDLVTRTTICAQERSKFEKPMAFISHDSRDKADLSVR